MKNKYIDLIEQTFNFPQEEFKVNNNQLSFHGISLIEIIREYGTPLKITYLPKISQQIQKAKSIFNNAIKKTNYSGKYHYCYCTKSSHFSFVIDEALKNDIHIETSSAFDINIIKNLNERGKFNKDRYIICNGYKKKEYIENITYLIESRFKNTIVVLDNENELNNLQHIKTDKIKIGIRIASEEIPKFQFHTSRLGIGYKNIIPFYKENIKKNRKLELKMLHFFINTGIADTAYYWSELTKAVNIYAKLKKITPELQFLNIGGGFPIKNSLNFKYDYEYISEEIVFKVKQMCDTAGVPPPDIFTEFGSFTVGESGAMIYSVLEQKKQNGHETWNIIDSSFMTTLPDSWALNKKFIVLAINNWDKEYQRVILGGLTCDNDDYYNSEAHKNDIYLPKINPTSKQYIGFFNTGAYQETLGGYGGLQHCLLPMPKHIVINKKKNGKFESYLFRDEQTSDSMLNILGY
ncbi:MAG: arginine decarboxylase [Chlorobi bacterium]|nr:arginine decarboxylase [Chlorobiota bacterium]